MGRHSQPWFLFTVLVWLLAWPAEAQAEESAGLAQKRFETGLSAYDEKHFQMALGEFQASYQLFASPNSRLYIARCLRELGRRAEAVLEYNLTARHAADRARTDPRYERTREAAEQEVAALRGQVGYVRLTIQPADARVEIDGRVIPPEALGMDIPVDPGRQVVTARAEGFAVKEVRIEVVAGGTQAVRLTLEALPKPKPPPPPQREPGAWRTLKWVGAGALLVGTAGFLTFYTLADQRFQSLDEACNSGPCPADKQSDIDRGRTYETLTNVSFGVGAAGLVLGAVAWGLDDAGEAPTRVAFGPSGVHFRTRF